MTSEAKHTPEPCEEVIVALDSLHDAAQWALTPRLLKDNSASYDALERALRRAKTTISRVNGVPFSELFKHV